MTTRFNILAKKPVDTFADVVSLGDVVKYELDATGWQEDNSTITSAVWTVESGSASISNDAVASGVASALVTFSQAGKVLLSVLLNTSSHKKKIWLEINVKDRQLLADDYGFGA